jgi:NADH:ubiquinone oxidoreductase subunit K
MAGIFDSIPIIAVILFAIGLVGVMVYERSRTKQTEESAT